MPMDKPLTLTIISPKTLEAEPIVFNYEELKGAITNIAETYKGMTYGEDEIKQGKSDRAMLRKFRTAIEDKRKEVKAICLKPYEDFEPKIKDLVSLIDEPIALIDAQVKEYEQKTINEKLEEAKAYYESKVVEMGLEGVVSWEKLYDKRFENLGMTLKKITEQLDERLGQVAKDWTLFEGMDTPYIFEIKKEYTETLDMGKALAKEQELRHQAEEKVAYEKAVAERKQRDAEAREAEVKKQTETLAGTAPSFYDFPKPEKIKEPQYRVTFTVTGTHDQLIALANFLKTNNYDYTQEAK